MSDVKLFRPQRLTDNDDGGGLATSIEVVDGQVNNIFDDISRIDRVNGELSLRKAFVIAATPDTDLFSDIHLTVQTPPSDPRVSVVMFKTDGWADERDDAKAAVERFLDESVISRMIPYDRQLKGQRTVLVFQRPELSLPEIGQVLALKDDTLNIVEFIRVSDMDHEVQTFTDAQGDFAARVITLTISQPLSREFVGSQPNRMFVSGNSVVIRQTIASDAARYKGSVVLDADASIGDLTLKVDTIFAQLVPSATTEIPVADAHPTGIIAPIPASVTPMVVNAGVRRTAGSPIYLPVGVKPGTFLATGDPRGSIADDSKGNVVRTGNGTDPAGSPVGRIDYNTGVLTPTTLIDTFTGIVCNFIPAAGVAKAGLSYAIPVEIQNRGYVYVTTLRPIPTPGSTVVSYRALGKWYTLQDDGTGILVADNISIGTGQINFATGTMQLTLGALPDVGSEIIIGFGGQSEYQILDADTSIQIPTVEFSLGAANCEPNTVSISWTAGGVTKTATDNGSGGLTGDATGRVIYATGEVVLRPTLLPDSNAVFSTSYEKGVTIQDDFTPSAPANIVNLMLSQPPRPGSIRIEYSGRTPAVLASGYIEYARVLTDDGVGHLLDSAGVLVGGSTVNYATGAISFNTLFNRKTPGLVRTPYENPIPGRVTTSGGGYRISNTMSSWGTSTLVEDLTATFVGGTPMTVIYKDDGATDDTVTGETISIPPLSFDLTPLVINSVVPGGLVFKLGGRTYYDRNGSLLYNISTSTGSGSNGGSVDYASGKVTITSWEGAASPALDVQALLTEVAPLPLAVIHGRAPGSPLRPNSFFIQAVRYRDGALISGLADNNGNITTDEMHGVVDVTNGTFSVAFGSYVLDSSLTTDQKAEDWYSASNVLSDGYIWKPDEARPGTVTFNCVVQTSLPQDPEIIKVNPIRLPLDGRVPVIRTGDTLVVSNLQGFTLPTGLTSGQVVTLPRTGLASLGLYDAGGLGIPTTKYTADLDLGTLTMADPLDLTGYVEPLVAVHVIEDMTLCLDAQITGDLVIGSALSHDYTAGETRVSSALILGDGQARYEHLFAQNSFTNVWSDTLIGSAPTGGGQYNDATFPVQVKNADAITQRWRITFTNSTTYNVIGEKVGTIATGTTSANCAPVNPATGLPYFTILSSGWGAGWATGNTLRFNTVAAGAPIWLARTVLSGPPTELDDLCRIDVRWDKD